MFSSTPQKMLGALISDAVMKVTWASFFLIAFVFDGIHTALLDGSQKLQTSRGSELNASEREARPFPPLVEEKSTVTGRGAEQTPLREVKKQHKNNIKLRRGSQRHSIKQSGTDSPAPHSPLIAVSL